MAFLLPVIEALDPNSSEVQALILVPSRELAIQIEQVVRNMGSGFKVNAVYGGRPMSKDKIELKHVPAILIGIGFKNLLSFASHISLHLTNDVQLVLSSLQISGLTFTSLSYKSGLE